LRLVQDQAENRRVGGDDDKSKRASWIGWAFGKKDETPGMEEPILE
jgi:hypothetical protein